MPSDLEKTMGILVAEGFRVKIANISFRESGLDPDRFVRERGKEEYLTATSPGAFSPTLPRSGAEYAKAIRGSQSHEEYLIERARQQFPGASADAKIKAMNYLLPHIRRIPHKLERDQFAHDAAQKLGIDSAVLREELRQAALKRQDHVEARPSKLTEVERVLLRALAITSPENEQARRMAINAISAHPERFEHLGSVPCLQALATRLTADPMDAVEDPAQRALLAEVLLAEIDPPSESEVHSALLHIQERALESQRRAIIAQIAEAEARGDFAEVVLLTQQKMALDKELRKLHDQ